MTMRTLRRTAFLIATLLVSSCGTGDPSNPSDAGTANPSDLARARAGDRNLSNANLNGADLSNANLTNATLTEQNDGRTYDRDMILMLAT